MTTSAQHNIDPSPTGNFENSHLSSTSRAIDAITFHGLLLIVVAAAIPVGAVDSPFQLIFASSIYLLCALRSIEALLTGRFAFANKTLLAPCVGLLILTVIQVLPLSLTGGKYISLDPYETFNFLLVVGALVVLGESLLQLTNTWKRLITVTATVLVIGIGHALFGVLRQALPGVMESLSLSTADMAPAQYGQFINRNHFALLIEMTLGILLGLALKAGLSRPWKAAIWIAIGFCWFAIISANSRGGIMSAAGVIILAVFVHFMTRTKRRRSGNGRDAHAPSYRLKPILATSALIVIISGALIVSVAFIGGDTTVSRFEKTDREFDLVDNGRGSRLEIWQSTLSLIAAYPVAGSGFGAYSRSITPYDTSSGKQQMIQQAHNEYLEIIAGGGAIAALLTLLFLGGLVRCGVDRFNERRTLGRAVGFGAAAGISGVLLHSFVDFGLHVQINALVFVLLIVLACASGDSSFASGRGSSGEGSPT